MDHQATMNGARHKDSSAQAVLKNLALIAHDMMRLAGLQTRLLAADLRAVRKNVIAAIVLWALAAVLLLAVLPTALIGSGLAISYGADIPAFAGLLLAALIGLLLSAGLILIGMQRLKRNHNGLERSRTELRINMDAMSHALSTYAQRGPDE